MLRKAHCNPTNDAEDVYKVLKQLKFETYATTTSRLGVRVSECIQGTSTRLRPTVGLFTMPGHGIQVQGEVPDSDCSRSEIPDRRRR